MLVLAKIIAFVGTLLASACVVVLLWCTYMLIKNRTTSKIYNKYFDAICDYQLECAKNGASPTVSFDDMEDYEDMLYRWWYWGSKYILPADKKELIDKYIK